MKVFGLTLGPLGTNCYLVWQEGERNALLVDSAGDPDDVLEAARERDLEIKLLVNTHGHSDHIESAASLKRLTGADLYIHEVDAPMLADPALSGATMFGLRQGKTQADRLLHEGDEVSLGGTGLSFTVLHTPGHTAGSICLLREKVLFSGDCLFAGGIGRVDLPGGDAQAMMASLTRLVELDPDTVVYPGHGPATTIGAERENNPWLGHR
jgi:hydroxyacylglutathione hydrolase